MHPHLIAALAAVVHLAPGPSVLAAPADPSQDVELELELTGEGWSDDFAREVEADLAAELARDELTLVGTGAAAAPVASIQLELSEGERVRIEIRILDALTDKTVLRELDLRETPLEARSLEVAIAAEELLQASWAELALTPTRATPAREAPPAAVKAVVERRLEAAPAPERPPSPLPQPVEHRVSAHFVTQGSTRGMVWLGVGASYELWPIEHLGIGFGLGASGLAPVRRPSGKVSGITGFGEFALSAGAVRSARAGFDLLAGARGFILRVRGRTGDGITQTSTHVLGELRLGARPSVRVGPVWMFAAAELTFAPGQLLVRDNDVVLTGYGGLGVAASLGIIWPLTPHHERSTHVQNI